MTTKLTTDLKREVSVGKEAFTLTLTPAGFTLAPKGRRKGISLTWADLVSGEAALAVALNASLSSLPAPPSRPVVKRPARAAATPKAKREAPRAKKK